MIDSGIVCVCVCDEAKGDPEEHGEVGFENGWRRDMIIVRSEQRELGCGTGALPQDSEARSKDSV